MIGHTYFKYAFFYFFQIVSIQAESQCPVQFQKQYRQGKKRGQPFPKDRYLAFLIVFSRLLQWHQSYHDDVIKGKHFPRYWPFVRGIHRSPVNSPYKDQWRGALIFSLIPAWTNSWANNGDAGGLSRYRAHYDITIMDRHCARYVAMKTMGR